MPALLIKSAKIVAKGHPLNGKKRDILIEKGMIAAIATKIDPPKNADILEQNDLHISAGWVDMAARFCEPGLEYKEDFSTGLAAAAAGGFTHAVVMPSTLPVIDSKQGVEFVKQHGSQSACRALPAGALSQQMEGKQLTEFYDMSAAGAHVFTDDKQPVDSTELMHRAIEYAKNMGALIYSFPHDNGIVRDGIMHEGAQSTLMGTKGIPAVAETIRLERDLGLLSHTGGRLHILAVSSKEAVEVIRSAKKNKLEVSAGVAAHQLLFTDKELNAFDSHYKVLPPLREEKDRKALIKGIASGAIDCIFSDHSPEDVEHKKVELSHAAFGISSLETAFAVARTATSKELALDELVACLCENPRKILGLETASFEQGSLADFTLFCPNTSWTPSSKEWKSKSLNNPAIGRKLTGKVVAVVRGKHISTQIR